MLYAMLATISTALPVATPTPTASIDAISGWEKADVIGSLFLGITALAISLLALWQTFRQQRMEEDMRQRELKIAAFDKILFIYDFIVKDLQGYSFYNEKIDDSINKLNTVSYMSFFLFEGETYNQLYKLIDMVGKVLKNEAISIEELLAFIQQYSISISSEELQRMKDLYNTSERAIATHYIRNAAAQIGKNIFSRYRLKIKVVITNM